MKYIKINYRELIQDVYTYFLRIAHYFGLLKIKKQNIYSTNIKNQWLACKCVDVIYNADYRILFCMIEPNHRDIYLCKKSDIKLN